MIKKLYRRLFKSKVIYKELNTDDIVLLKPENLKAKVIGKAGVDDDTGESTYFIISDDSVNRPCVRLGNGNPFYMASRSELVDISEERKNKINDFLKNI